MAVRDDFAAGEVLAAADLNDTFASKLDVSGDSMTGNLSVDSGAGSSSVITIGTDDEAVLSIRGDDTHVKDIRFFTDGGHRFTMRVSGVESGSNTGSDFTIIARDDSGVAIGVPFSYTRSTALTRLSGVGAVTTAGGANVNTDTSGNLRRSTSSIKYKTDVETLEDDYADKVLTLRPVWYRSLADLDNSEWSHYGLIAEEVAEVDPRLVHFGENEDGSLEPEGVQYERIVPHLINLVQRQQAQIEALTARLDAAGL